MDVLYLTEAEVKRLLTMEMALEALEGAFRAAVNGQATNHPRRRFRSSQGSLLLYMAALDESSGYFGLKIYTAGPTGVRFLVLLYENRTGHLSALLEADYLGCVRTGAASGLATKLMARADASRVGILGTGHQAPTQLQAIARVRSLESVRAYSRNPERRRDFAARMSEEMGLRVDAADSPEAAVREADIVVTVTSSREPVLRGAWLAPGAHVNAAGANFARKRELDDAAIARASRLVVDSREQAKLEAGDLIDPFQANPERWEDVAELSQLVAGASPGRSSQQEITLFKSLGVALEDVATAARVVERARREGVGKPRPMWAADLAP